MKGILLAGGKGTRLLPATKLFNKHMIPILNRPMIIYPIETLKSLGITEITIVTGGNHIGGIADFLEDGSDYGVSINYVVQKEAGGIAQALGLVEKFVGDDHLAVILGDNIFDNDSLKKAEQHTEGRARVYVKSVKDPERFGVLFSEDGKYRIEEKPKNPTSTLAVTGLYIYPPDVFEVIKTLKPSARGELEISDVNNHYINKNSLEVSFVDGFWSDAGTPESLMEVTNWAFLQES